mgnify:FL=1
MSIYKKFTKYVTLIGLINITGQLKGIIVLPIITKLLGAMDFGIWTQLRVTVNLLTPFILLDLPGSIVRFLAAEKDKEEIQEGVYSVLALVAAIASIVALFFIIFSSPISKFFQADAILIKIFSFVLIFECINTVMLSVLEAFQEMKKYSAFIISQLIGELLLIIGFILAGYGLYGVIISLLIIRLITFSFLFTFIFRRIGIKIPTFSPMKKYFYFSLPSLLGSISYWVVAAGDRYLIGIFLGVIFVGFYAPAYAIGSILTFFIIPPTFILSIMLPKSFDENKMDEVKSLLRYSLKYFLLITIPSVFGLSILSRQLLVIFSTSQIADNAYFITPFIALSILFYGIACFLFQILVLAKKTKIIGALWLLAAILNLGLNILLIPRFGILAAAITTLAAYLFVLMLAYYFSFKEFQFEIEWSFIAKSIIASVLMGFFIALLNPFGLFNVLLTIILAALIYSAIIFLLKGVTKKEIIFFKDLIQLSVKIKSEKI